MPLFTSELAKLYRAKSLASYRRNRELEKQRAEREAQAAFIPAQPEPLAQQPPLQPDDFCAKRIKRVRRQLAMLDRLIDAEQDPQRLDRLACAQYRLSEMERILSGRPLPGSQRPRQAKVNQHRSAVEPE